MADAHGGQIAGRIDTARFGVKAVYVIGSTANATAGPPATSICSSFRAAAQRSELILWLGLEPEPSEMNYLRTGYQSDGLLDVHLVTDEDIAARTSFAVRSARSPIRRARSMIPLGEGAWRICFCSRRQGIRARTPDRPASLSPTVSPRETVAAQCGRDLSFRIFNRPMYPCRWPRPNHTRLILGLLWTYSISQKSLIFKSGVRQRCP